MPIFIAKTYDGKVENIVFSKSRELAVAYWHGKDIHPHSIHVVSDQNLENHPTGVLPILSTKKLELGGMTGKHRKYLVVE
ncbi:hypothetical protein LCGC14_1936030 [marine sediment metagenome]|uniref:Uncharacterized protein n=1 Tax=marine sediment metagenome TaxID=412755 RepID=A0A0F9FM32_9ZZZZ